MNSIFLSTKGFCNIPNHSLLPNFTISFKDTAYSINSMLADFISPKIAGIHRSDPLFSNILIPIDDPNMCFENVINAIYGNPLVLNSKSMIFFTNVFQFLENREILSVIENLISDVDITIENAVFKLLEKNKKKYLFEKEIEFIAQHFLEIPYDDISILDVSMLCLVLANDRLVVNSEGSLLHFIQRIVNEKGNDFFQLYNYVLYENLSREEISLFFDGFDASKLTGAIWNSLCKRMNNNNNINNIIFFSRYKGNISIEKGDEKVKVPKKYRYYEGINFNGIITILTQERNRNIQDAGIVVTSASSIYDDRSSFDPKESLNIFDSSYFLSKNLPDSWIMFDFIDKEIEISRYVIKSYGNQANSHLKCWDLEVSQDQTNWTLVDRKINDFTLKTDWGIGTFKCFNKSKGRYVRLRQTGENHRGTYYILICAVEFYGKLYS